MNDALGSKMIFPLDQGSTSSPSVPTDLLAEFISLFISVNKMEEQGKLPAFWLLIH